MTLDRLTQITSVGITSGITLNNATLTGVTTIASLDSVGVGGTITAVDGNFSGNVSIAGTLTYEDVTNIDSIGIITARDTIDAQGNVTVGAGLSVVGVSTLGNTVVGGATTELVVGGDARITGILTVGSSSITIDGTTNTVSTTNLTVNGNAYPSAGPLSNRNLIINGAMQVFQRGTSETGLGAINSVYSTVDRFKHFTGNTDGRFTADAISIADLPGFTRALKLSCTTADTSIASNEFMGINYLIEGQDLQQLKKGTSDAEALILSFYVKGNAAATYTFEARDLDNDRVNARTFDVTTSWVKIEIPFVGDTTGAYDDDNGASLQLAWWLHAGSDYTSGTFANTNTWATRTQANRVSSSNDSFFDSTSRTFFITGVQLEVGETATPFEHRSYGEELALCQRYYVAMGPQGNTNYVNEIGVGYCESNLVARGYVQFPTTMRSNPTVTSDQLEIRTITGFQRNINSPTFETNENGVYIDASNTGFTAGAGGLIRLESNNGKLEADAEL